MDENKEFVYTMVLNGTNAGSPESATLAGKTVERQKKELEGNLLDRLYFEYESMWLKDPNVLDRDDIYPHSYQWRMGGRMDPAKAEVLKEAVMTGKRIADTDAYQKYVQAVTRRKFIPESWD